MFIKTMYYNKISLIFALFVFGFPESLTDSQSNHFNTVEEVNHALCKIVTEDIQASANATITRQLKGVCTSKELNRRIDQLEKRILREIYLIKQALHIKDEIPPSEDNYKLTKTLENTLHTYDTQDYDYLNAIETVESKNTYHPQTITYRSSQNSSNQTSNLVNKSNNITNAFIPISIEKPPTFSINSNQTSRLHISYKRDFEAAKYNVTVQSTESGKTFLYFWKIYDVEEIRSYTDNSLESPLFYVSGHPIQIRFYPHHQGTNYAAVELFSNDNIVLKHRFTILNQNNEQGDLTSQILGVNAPRFRISNEKLFNGDFTTDGSLTIKVAIKLHS